MPDDILDAAKTLTADPPITTEPLPQPPEPDLPAPEVVIPPSIPEPDNTPIAQTDSSVVERLLKTNNPEPVVPGIPKQNGTMPKKGPPKGLILGIIALFLLILPVSVYFISQQNQQLTDMRSRATGAVYSCGRESDPGAPECCTYDERTNCNEPVCEPPNRLECKVNAHRWCTIEIGGCRDGDDTGDDDTTNPTATPTTGIAPICQNIKIYKDGVQVANLPGLRTGDAVILAVKGNLTPIRAHFRVNGGSWTETTTTNSSGEFILAYTMPAGVTEFVIEGEVFTNGAWR